MLYIDSHVHVGDATLVEKYVTTSEYRNRIRLYAALDSECVATQEEYLEGCNKYFGIPIVLKEIDVHSANEYLEEFVGNHEACIPVFLVGDDVQMYSRNDAWILKEHFLHHKADKWRERKSSYAYLNERGGYLLIHSSDSVRIDYVSMLREYYPNMKIIIAHMGRNVYEDTIFSESVIDAFADDENVFFDISTIKNPQILLYACQMIGVERILFGSDFPYEYKKDWKREEIFATLEQTGLCKEDMTKILYSNALRIIENK